MNSTFPGNMRDTEVLLDATPTTNRAELERVREGFPTYKQVRFGTEVLGTDGKTKFPIFGTEKE